ncbi:MAG: carbohydrate binding family 9 domain-containing protein [bacterium]|nr:carbohydrate binding family 9 domain-containing protein [bacterium]
MSYIKRRIIFIILFPVILGTFHLNGQKQEDKTTISAERFTISEATSKIKIDGVLDEEAWKHPQKIGIPYEWRPGENTPSPVKTECMITYSKSKFYIAFRCFDPEPGKIRAHLMDRDVIDTFVLDDHVTFTLDTFNDERRGFQFRVNPLGVQADAIFSELEGYEDFSWDAIWEASGRITEFGYVVEAAIAFNQLRFSGKEGGQTWGFEAQRSYPRNVRHRMNSHKADRNRSCILCQMNKITGLAGISPGRNLEFDPTITMNRTDERAPFPEGELEAGKMKFEPGITAKWGITPNIILNATVNPDFSQVEADVAQLEVNTRFALRYTEKRPFFMEGADFFLTPLEAVFTRTVHDPVWGAKMTGKMGKSAVGFFAAQDRYNNILFPSNQGSMSTSLDDDVYSGVLRYRRDVGKGSTVGALYTGRVGANDDDGDGYFNHVLGLDGFLRISRAKTFSFQYMHSQTQYPGEVARDFGQQEGAFGGDALSLWFTHQGRNFFYFAEYTDLGANFRADYGFIPRVDTRLLEGIASTTIWGKPGGWFDAIRFGVVYERISDHDSHLSNQEFEVYANYRGLLQSYFRLGMEISEELYNGITYDKNQFEAYLNFKPAGGWDVAVMAAIGEGIDYSNSRPADSIFLNPAIEFAVGKHLNINLNHIFQKLSLDGENIFTVNLLQTRFIYNINIRTFVRAILQYTHIDRNPGLYSFAVEAQSKQLFTQLLFSYKLNPKTVLFLGYSDNHHGWGGLDLTRANRTFFLKIGYALVL